MFCQIFFLLFSLQLVKKTDGDIDFSYSILVSAIFILPEIFSLQLVNKEVQLMPILILVIVFHSEPGFLRAG
jgi:hypothetical protein